MVFNQTTREDLRDLFCDAIIEIFGDGMTFLDFLENKKYSTKYDCFLDDSDENYIINSDTGEFINWYKLYHFGRCIQISALTTIENIPNWISDFMLDFKESGATNDNDR